VTHVDASKSMRSPCGKGEGKIERGRGHREAGRSASSVVNVVRSLRGAPEGEREEVNYSGPRGAPQISYADKVHKVGIISVL
jgi:hypothetical protein